MIQLVQPDTSVVGRIGYCLEMAENVYHTPHEYDNATEAYHATQFKHTDALPDASVPVWFSYIQNGVDLGHVVAYVPGRGFLSSPFKQNGTQVWFNSIADVEKTLSCHYLGWSEDIANVRIVEDNNMTQSEAEKVVTYLYRLGTGDYPSPGQADYWVPRVRDVPTGVDELGTAMLAAKPTAPSTVVPYSGPPLFVKG